jgi:adhesin HecA-like repeat protein
MPIKPTLKLAGTIILFVVVVSTTLMADPVLSVQPPSVNVTSGQNFSVDVIVSGVTDLFAYQFDLGFNPSVVRADGVTEGSFLATGGSTLFIPGSIDNVGGAVSNNGDTLLTAISGVSGGGTLASFEFTAVGGGSSSLDIFNTIVLDSSLSGITTTVQNTPAMHGPALRHYAADVGGPQL